MANEGLREMADLLDRVVPRMLEIEESLARIGAVTVGGGAGSEQAIRTANQLLGGAASTVGGFSGGGGGGGFGGFQRVGQSEGEARINQTLQQGFDGVIRAINTQGGQTQAVLFSIGGF